MNPQKTEKTSLESSLHKGELMYWRKRHYIIEGWSSKAQTIDVTDCETSTRLILDYLEVMQVHDPEDEPIFGNSIQEIQQKIKDREERNPETNISEAGIRPSYIEQAQEIIDVVEGAERAVQMAIDIAKKTPGAKRINRTKVIKEYLKTLQKRVSLATYYVYRRIYQINHGIRAQIARSLTTSRYGKTRQSPALLHLVGVLVNQYLFPKKGLPRRPRTVFKILNRTLERTQGMWPDPGKCGGNIPEDLISELLDPKISFDQIAKNPEKRDLFTVVDPPHQSWFYDRVAYLKEQRSIPEEIAQTAFFRLGHRVQAPLELELMDEWELSISRERNGVREKIIDLWLTLVLDSFPRCIPGFWLHWGTPDAEVALSALRYSIFPKDLRSLMGFPVQLPFGISKVFSMDNAMIHDMSIYTDLSRALSMGGEYRRMDITFRPRRQPKYGSYVEAMLGNFSLRFHEVMDDIVWFVEENMTTNTDKQAQKIVEYVTRHTVNIINEYHHTTHSELHQRPIDCWNESVDQVLGMPKVPPLTPGLERMFLPAVYGTRTAKDSQISLYGMHYVMAEPVPDNDEKHWLPTLNDLGQKIQYTIHSSPRDISRISIFRDGRWKGDMVAKELLGPDGKTLRPVSKVEHKIAHVLARQAGALSKDWMGFLGEDDGSRTGEINPDSPKPPSTNTNGKESKSTSNKPKRQSPPQYWNNVSDSLSGFIAPPDDEEDENDHEDDDDQETS